MIDFCQFGAGRIGAIHAKHITGHPNARLRVVVDPDRAAAERLAGRHGAAVGSQAEALADRAVKAVVIASSTDTHADLLEAAHAPERRCSAKSRSTSTAAVPRRALPSLRNAGCR